MAILNFQVDSIGQSGVVPKMIYLQTNNTISEIEGTPGYLNSLVAQGNTLSSMDMALVTTTDSPNTELFNVAHSGGNWSLTQYGAPPAPTAAWLLGGNSDTSGSSTYLGTSNARDLFFKTHNIIVCQVTSGQAVIWGNTTTYEINAATSFSVITPNVFFNAQATQASQFLVAASALPSGVGGMADNALVLGQATTNPTSLFPAGYGFLYVGQSDGNLYFGNSTNNAYQLTPPGGGGSGWNTTGTNSGAGLKLGTTGGTSFDVVVGSISLVNFTAGGGVHILPNVLTTDLQMGNGNAIIQMTATDFTLNPFSGGSVAINAALPNGFTLISSFAPIAMTSTSGNVSLEATNGTLSLATGTFNNIISIDGKVSGTCRISIGFAHCTQIVLGGSGASFTGAASTWLVTAGTSAFIQSPIIHIGTTTLNASITLGSITTSNLFGFGASISMHANTSASFDSSDSVDVAATDALQLFLSRAACTTIFDATILQMPNMPAAIGGEKAVMIDPVTGQLRISP